MMSCKEGGASQTPSGLEALGSGPAADLGTRLGPRYLYLQNRIIRPPYMMGALEIKDQSIFDQREV